MTSSLRRNHQITPWNIQRVNSTRAASPDLLTLLVTLCGFILAFTGQVIASEELGWPREKLTDPAVEIFPSQADQPQRVRSRPAAIRPVEGDMAPLAKPSLVQPLAVRFEEPRESGSMDRGAGQVRLKTILVHRHPQKEGFRLENLSGSPVEQGPEATQPEDLQDLDIGDLMTSGLVAQDLSLPEFDTAELKNLDQLDDVDVLKQLEESFDVGDAPKQSSSENPDLPIPPPDESGPLLPFDVPKSEGPDSPLQTSRSDFGSLSRSEELQANQELCAEELKNFKASTLADVDLNISILGTEGEDFPFECSIDDGQKVQPRCWSPVTYRWTASKLYHKPLYFEEVDLERYGHSWGPCLQPLVSGAHFFTRLPVLPYCIGYTPPCECQYALGYYRPGNCAPYLIPAVPVSTRAAFSQAGAAVGTAFIIP